MFISLMPEIVAHFVVLEPLFLLFSKGFSEDNGRYLSYKATSLSQCLE